MNEAGAAPRLVEVDAMRGIAAVAVVLFHYSTRYDALFGHRNPLGWALPFGYLGVNLFFMLSGFVILMTLARTRVPLDFVVSRFSRLYPAYWAAVLCSFAVVTLAGLPGKTVGTADLLANFSMVHTWFNRPSVDDVYWTLGVEMIFYGLAFILFASGRLQQVGAFVVLLLGMRIGYFIAEHGFGISLPFLVFRFLVLGFIPYFGLGIALYLAHAQGRMSASGYALVFACLGTIVVVESPLLALVALVLYLALAAAVAGRVPVLRCKPLVWLGAISYPLYLLHENIGWSLIHTLERAGWDSNLSVLAAIVTALLLAHLLHVSVEMPAMRYIRMRYRQRPGISRAG